MSYYSPPSPRSMPDAPASLMPVTPTGPPPPLSRSLSQGHASSYYSPPSPNSAHLSPAEPSFPSTPLAPQMPQIPSFPIAQPVHTFDVPTQILPRTSVIYVFVPTNEGDRHSLDQRLPVPKYVRSSNVVEKDSQQRVFSIVTDVRKKESRVRDSGGQEIAVFVWGSLISSRIRIQGEKETRCRDWMQTHPSPHFKFVSLCRSMKARVLMCDRARLIRHRMRPYIWISRGDVDIIESPGRPGVPLAVVRRDEYNLVEIEMFHEALVGVPDLLQTFVFAIVYMRVDGSSGEARCCTQPKFASFIQTLTTLKQHNGDNYRKIEHPAKITYSVSEFMVEGKKERRVTNTLSFL
ncbi:hypothetical protein K488DRAFT_72603 [Vararia minispora EC-137]|uniref:Uncharacterized protein n=1 Tax=Vararia minispora EC-137 TaxID=1314806 RepID=A0ACB8QEA9_9AGAM|nr:hypothetical protein K488DRAFT_72603 [Vararia minispora EC-137]